MRTDNQFNMADLMVIFHNVLDTDTTEKIYRDNVLPKKNYDSVIDQLTSEFKRNPCKLTAEEKDIISSEASDMLEMFENIEQISEDIKSEIQNVVEQDFSVSTLNASGVGEQIFDMWEEFKGRIYDNQDIGDSEYDYFQKLDVIVEKTGWI
tara:strand:- start:15425 stop:15877 length:453 start_codon:yes stop_codon:yes gene_type:complete